MVFIMKTDTFVSMLQKNFNEFCFEATAMWAKCDLDERKEAFCEAFFNLDLSVYTERFLVNVAKNEVSLWVFF